MSRPIALIVAVVLGAVVHAGEAAKPAAQTGSFVLSLDATSPMSAWPVLSTRFGWNAGDGPAYAYDIAKEPFDVYVPASYDGTRPFGLIAYISPGKGGGPGGYASVLDRHDLIWIGNQNVENERGVPFRQALTLDGVHGILARYRIDPERIYVAGMSGGGRCASEAAPRFPDVYTGGGIYFVGCNAMDAPGGKDSNRLRELAKTRRYAFMTGETDFNKPGTQSVFAQYKGAGFPHIAYYETPGLGHEMPPADWFDKAMVELDRPLLERATQLLAQAEALDAKGKTHEAYVAYTRASASSVARDIAAKAAPRMAELATTIDQEGATDLDAILAKPTAAKLKAFVTKWADFPVGERARGEADKLGVVELGPIIAEDAKPRAAKLRKFIAEWEGYPVAGKALIMLDELAQAEWPAVEAATEGKRLKALAGFIKEWSPTPTAISAEATLETALDAELETIKTTGTPAARFAKLQQLAKAWPDTRAGREATRAVEQALAAQEAAKKQKK
ncbi:MAG TPA: PHB depolymerase family esterase [Planctomycetota bacterium]|nr:PHB depolymerase family esterase [Planctomycetota bacterium]